MNRGILSTIYVQTNRSTAEALELARAAYATEPFVRVRPSSDLPSISAVAHSNFCDFTYCGGQEGQPLIVVSVIDNLIKGSSGQALQNFNIMFGMDERMGLI
jgi:N-acetyl-gamma-glutamyl-phosphate reductase